MIRLKNWKCTDSLSGLRKPQKKHHTIPAEVLPNDSDALFIWPKKYSFLEKYSLAKSIRKIKRTTQNEYIFQNE